MTEQLLKNTDDESTHVSVTQQKKNIERILKQVNENQEATKLQEKRNYDAKATGDCFKIGERVLLFNPAVKLGMNRKFSPIYVGPFTIIEKVGEVNFRIKPDD